MAKISCNIISYTLQRTVDIEVILPTVTIPESLESSPHHVYPKPYPVLYLLHGFGNNHAQWGGYTRIEMFGEERHIAVVMISGENKNYLDMGNDKFYDFIENELPEFITNTFPISKKPEDTYIAGLSMGGFGALVHGLKNSEKYHAIGAFSPALGNVLDTGEVDVSKITQEKIKNNENFPDMFITCGDQDFLIEPVRDYIKALEDAKIKHTWIEEPGYIHEWRFWDLSVERFLDWIDRKDYYQGKKRKV